MPQNTNEANRFNFAAAVATIAPAGEGASKGLRTFSGIAYTGDAITSHHYWRSVVFDLSSITIAPKVPALIDHAASKRREWLWRGGLGLFWFSFYVSSNDATHSCCR